MKIDGLKTHIGWVAAGLYGVAISLGWMDWNDGYAQAIAAAIAAWTGVAITHKVDKAVDSLAGWKMSPPNEDRPPNHYTDSDKP